MDEGENFILVVFAQFIRDAGQEKIREALPSVIVWLVNFIVAINVAGIGHI